MKTFSILIPTFNSAKTLPVSLQSIANQTFKDVEVIIMDGASADNTLEVANTFKESIAGLKVYSQPDDGIYHAMNKALDYASGAWVLFLGSDDSLHGKHVLEQINQKTNAVNAAVVYGNAKIVGDTGWAKDGDLYDGPFTLNKLLNKNICHQAIFYKRDFLQQKIGYFNPSYKKSADWDYNLRCWAKGKFAFVDCTIANFLAGGYSTHANDDSLEYDFVNNVLNYFSINPFDNLVNNPNFIFYADVVKIQRTRYPVRYKWFRFKKKLLKKIRL